MCAMPVEGGTQGKLPTGRSALKGIFFAVCQVHCKGHVSLTCMRDLNIVSPTDQYGLMY